MEAEAAKYIGAGLACLGMAGAGIGVGNLFGQYLSGALRNPSASQGQFSNRSAERRLGKECRSGSKGTD